MISEYEMVQHTSMCTWDTFHPYSLICIFVYVLLVHQLRLRPGEPIMEKRRGGSIIDCKKNKVGGASQVEEIMLESPEVCEMLESMRLKESRRFRNKRKRVSTLCHLAHRSHTKQALKASQL